jgi:predicted transcriptional regulator
MSMVEQAAPVLAHVPSVSLPPAAFFHGAEVVRPTRLDPDAPTNRCTTVFKSSTELSALLPVVTERWLTALQDRAVADRRTTLSIDREVIDRLRTRSEPAVNAILDADATDLTAVTESIPFGVILGDGQATLVVHDERGVLVGLVVAESDEATRWATDLIETYSTTHDDSGN